MEQINAKEEVVIAKLDYDEIGELKNKALHSLDGNAFIHTTDFAYNERGWLKSSINNLFSMQLDYHEKESGSITATSVNSTGQQTIIHCRPICT